LRRLDEQSRIIAIDPSSPLLDVARRKAGDASGKRIFFRTEGASPRLSFADEVYDLVLCNLGLDEVDDPRAALVEFARVAKPDGQVVATIQMRGTWGEFYDIYREVLIKHDMHDVFWYIKEAIDAYFRDRAFAVTVVAGCLRGSKLAAAAPAEGREMAAPIVRVQPKTGEEIEVNTGSVAIESVIPLDENGDDDE